MRRLLPFLPLAILAALFALFAGYGLHHDPRVVPAALVGRPAPRLALAPLGGGAPRTFPELGGREPVLVNMFASWCGPCAAEAPELAALKARGVRILGVAYKDDPVETRRFLDRLGDPFAAVAMDPDGRAGVEWGVSGVPETFLVDPSGKVLAKHAGAISAGDAQALIAAMRGPGVGG